VLIFIINMLYFHNNSNRIILVLFKEFIKRLHNDLKMSLLISLINVAVLPANITNVFHINVIAVRKNIFQIWNIPN